MPNLATISNNILADSGIDPINLIVGTGTVNYVPKFTSEDTLAISQIFDNGTNVGISINLPTAKLHIVYAGDDNPGIRLQGDATDTNLEFRTNNGYATIQAYDSGFVTAGVVSINPLGGNLLVGQTNDDGYKLQINGVSRSKGEALLGNYANLADFGQVGIYATNSAWADGFGSLVLSSRHDAARPILFTTYNGTSVGERVRIASAGSVRFNAYGSGAITGTPTYRLAVDAVGNVIEVTDGGGTITGSGVSGQVAFWNGSSSITGESNFLWDASANKLTTTNGSVEFGGIQQNSLQSILTLVANNNSGESKGLYVRLIAGTPEWQIVTGAVGADAGIRIIPNGSSGLTIPFGTGASSFSNSLNVGNDLAVNNKVGIGGAVGVEQLFVYNSMAKVASGTGWGMVVQDTNSDGVAGRGGAIAFGAYRSDGGRFNVAAVAGAKSNSTGTNENGDLVLYSSVASSLTERVRVLSAGRTLMGPTMPTDDGESALQVSGGNIRANEQVVTYRRFVARFNDIQTICAELYEDGASTNGGTLNLFGKSSGTVDTVISAAPTKLNYINNAANFMVGWSSDQGFKLGINGDGLINGTLQIGSSSLTTINLFLTRTNSAVRADANYFVASANTPNHSWIEGGYFTGELAGVITAPNSGYPYFEVWAGQGSITNKSFGFVNKTSGNFTSSDLLYTLSLLRTGQVRLPQYGAGTFTGTVSRNLAVDSSGNIIETEGGVVDGSGTTNRIPKWSDSNTLTDSLITDNGTTINIARPLTTSTRVSIGGAGDQPYASLFIGGDITNGTNHYAILLDPQLSGVNNYAIYANARIKAATAATNAYGVFILNSERLSGATIANNYGLFIQNQTAGSTVNYSIYSEGGLNYLGGRLGLRVTNPGATLDVSGDASLVANFNFSSNGTYLRWQNNGTSFGDIGSAATLVSGGATNDFAIHARSTFNIIFSTDFSEKMRLTSSGSLGIGTSSVGYKLTVYESTTNPIAYFGLAPSNVSSRNALIVLQSGTIPQNGSDTTGEVGFLFKHSYGTGGVNGTANGGYIESIRESVFGITSQVNTALVFGTSLANVDGEAMRITSNKRVGINTTNPQSALQVNGQFRIYTTNDDANELRAIFNPGGAGDAFSISMYKADAATIGIRLAADGTTYFNGTNVLVGTTADIGTAFRVVGGSQGIDFETNNNSSFATSIFYTIRESGVSRTITSGGYSYGPSNPLTMILSQNSNTPLGMFHAADNAEGAGLKGFKSRGTVAAPVSVNNGDTIFSMEGWAFHGSGPNHAKFGAGMRFVKDDNFGTANTFAPQRTEFYNAVNTTTVQTNMIIYPNGNTAIGTGTYYGSYKLYVQGIVASNTGFLIDSGQYNTVSEVPYTGMYMTGSSSSDGFGALLISSRTDTARPIIFGTSNGSVSVERLRIAAGGAVTATSSITATSFFESSDSRIKTLLDNNFDYSLIANVVARYYEKNGVEELGYFAQDFEQILPSAVYKDDKGLLNLSYTQVHTAKIAALEKEVAELKKQLNNK
jgi:hypothetical protein